MADTVFELMGAFALKMREQFDNHDDNIFGIAFGQIMRYRGLLNILIGRHKEKAKIISKGQKMFFQKMKQAGNSSRLMTPEDIENMNKRALLCDELHVDIESFYLFADILVDRIANFLKFFFGESPGIKFSSNDKLRKEIEQWAKNENISLPKNFKKLMDECQRQIGDHRDDYITHKFKPRTTYGTTFSSTGENAGIAISPIYPTKEDSHIQTPPLQSLLDNIDSYLKAFMELLILNTNKTILRLKD